MIRTVQLIWLCYILCPVMLAGWIIHVLHTVQDLTVGLRVNRGPRLVIYGLVHRLVWHTYLQSIHQYSIIFMYHKLRLSCYDREYCDCSVFHLLSPANPDSCNTARSPIPFHSGLKPVDSPSGLISPSSSKKRFATTGVTPPSCWLFCLIAPTQRCGTSPTVWVTPTPCGGTHDTLYRMIIGAFCIRPL